MKVAIISDIHGNRHAFDAALEAIAESTAAEVWCLGDLVGLDLVVDPREGHGELVVGVADVREVRVYAPHDLGGEVDVYVALGA